MPTTRWHDGSNHRRTWSLTIWAVLCVLYTMVSGSGFVLCRSAGLADFFFLMAPSSPFPGGCNCTLQSLYLSVLPSFPLISIGGWLGYFQKFEPSPHVGCTNSLLRSLVRLFTVSDIYWKSLAYLGLYCDSSCYELHLFILDIRHHSSAQD